MKQRLILQAAAALISGCAGMTALSAASLDDIPNRKPGLWEITIMMAGRHMPVQTIRQCTDATTDPDMRSSFSPMAKEMCSQQNMQKTATGMVINSTCNIGGVASTSHVEINGDFNSAYTMKVSSSHPNAPAGMPKASETTMEAKWLGACEANQKAGDIIMPGGIKMNIKDMQAMRAMMPKHLPSPPPQH
jgi:hypothetical protein